MAIITGTNGSEIVYGTSGADKMYGLGGDDDLRGLEGDYGGAGNDELRDDLGTNYLDGGDGIDTVSFFLATAPLSVDLAAGTATLGASTDTLVRIENVTGQQCDLGRRRQRSCCVLGHRERRWR